MIEEERLKKGLIFEETTPRSPRRRLDKHAVLAQQRPDIRDLVSSMSESKPVLLQCETLLFRSNELEKVIDTLRAL